MLPEGASAEALSIQLTRLEDLLENSDVTLLERLRTKLEETIPLGIECLSLVFEEEVLKIFYFLIFSSC